ncbi:LOW QUALITY PROTEIN: metabotropic glutamate receptor 5-like [Babylonia areolata]|uniref:LOW QUALITY PROTEIN: metabotropic glutamate receptor 5-like n=1 Tax=Babylonia areolata TaxID=304850 RepID=UPI003FCF65BE
MRHARLLLSTSAAAAERTNGRYYRRGKKHEKRQLADPAEDPDPERRSPNTLRPLRASSSALSSGSGQRQTPPSASSSSAQPGSKGSYSAKRRMARKEGDIIIGALFPVHHHPPIQTAYSRVCGGIREYYGIQRIEAFMRTVDDINRDRGILPDIQLGWDIRDSCWYSAIALEQSIDFIQDAIASKTIRNGRLQEEEEKQQEASCSASLNKPIVGLVGPGSSEASIQVQNLMQIFNIPQIGYSATSMDLSDKNIFRYFLRVVPPDNYQVQALVDIVLAFNWTYISTVNSDGNYGIRGMKMFTDLAATYNICIASTDSVASSDTDPEFDRVVDTLRRTPNATVVVCFCEGITVKKLLKALSKKGADGRFLIIGSDGWGNRLDVVRGQEVAASGGISIKLYSPPLTGFDAYYASLRPNGSTAARNPWFEEFWQQKFQCYLPGAERDAAFNQSCTGKESLKNSDQDSKLGFVVNAVKTMALALHNMHSDLCPQGSRRGLCPEMSPVNGTLFLEYLLNVSFPSYSGHHVHFDAHGDPPGRYEILNYQPIQQDDGRVTYDYVTIGQWMTGALDLNVSAIYWPRQGRDADNSFRSVCSQPCGPGFVKQGVRSEVITCCWVCTPCKDNEIVVEEDHCSSCELGWWPNENKTDCEQISIEFVSWEDTGSVVVAAIACVGLLFTAWVTAIFVRSHNTPVVKASTRELSYILLLGIALAFSCNFLLVAKPAPVFCYLCRIVPGLAFSLMYGALVTRTNRIARILEGSKRIMTKKPRFMSATAQVVITGIIIGIECLILSAMLVIEPANSKLDYTIPRRVRLVCNTSTLGIIVPLGFDLFLIFMCTLYAVKTRNLPENFNEAKFIGFTMYTTCVIWLGFFPIYFGGQNKEVTMSICISLSAAIALVLLFFPKVYIILWAPEKNTRGAFTTSKDVRCHIGSKSMQSCDSVEFRLHIPECCLCNFEEMTREGRYDAVGKSDANTPTAWRQKSLDEKQLRFVMKRSSMPAQISSAAYINHGVLYNHRAATTTACSPSSASSEEPCGRLHQKNKKKSPHRLYVDDFSDFDSLMEGGAGEETRKKEGVVSASAGRGGGRFRDGECQTGEELVQALFLQLRRRRFHTSSSSAAAAGGESNTTPSPTQQQQQQQQPHHYNPHHTGLGTVKEVTFSPHVDSSCQQSDNSSHPHTPTNIYHRPPTPRTPRKLLIQNHNHGDLITTTTTATTMTTPTATATTATVAGAVAGAVGAGGERALPLDSLPSPHLLHVQGVMTSRSGGGVSASASRSLTNCTDNGGV